MLASSCVVHDTAARQAAQATVTAKQWSPSSQSPRDLRLLRERCSAQSLTTSEWALHGRDANGMASLFLKGDAARGIPLKECQTVLMCLTNLWRKPM